MAILDLGCGNGCMTEKLGRIAPRCVGMDMSKSGLEIARQRAPSIEFVEGAIETELPDALRGSFDLVTACEVIEHLFLPRQLFARAREALRPGGVFIVSTPYHGYWKNLALAISGKFDFHWHPLRDYGHIKFFSTASLGRLFEEEGFTVTSDQRVGRIPAFARSMLLEGRLPKSG